jgi:organic radical activating enzyme
VSYQINEAFYSVQGEGAKAGSACVFVRFAGCNLTCRSEEQGFDCDTEFVSGRRFDADALTREVEGLLPLAISRSRVGVIFTGGEPTLQLDRALLDAFVASGFYDLRLETNGTQALAEDVLAYHEGVNGARLWITCSPHTAEHTIRLQAADEVRYVRRHGQGIPRPSLKAGMRYISPAWGAHGCDPLDIAWCVGLVKENPEWRLSMQQHKVWGVR